MKRNHKVLAPVLFVLTMASCTVYRQIPIEVLRTEEIKLPVEKPKIAFIYRNFKFQNDTLQLYYLEDEGLMPDKKYRENEIDSMAVVSCLEGTANNLKEKGICSNPVLYPLDIFPRLSGEKVFALPVDLVKKLALPVKADYLVSLETISYFFSRYNETEENSEFQKVRMVAMWNLYNIESGVIMDHKTMIDTLYWDSNSKNPGQKPSVLPPRAQAIQQAAQIFGENYARRFYPEWLTVDRMIMIPPLEDFRVAGEFAVNQEWQKASAIWMKYADVHFGRLAISACYNLALSFEIGDDLSNALKWINSALNMAKSYKISDELTMVLQYQGILKQRLQEIEKSKIPDQSDKSILK
jgi:hypothetical protein